MLNPDLVPSRPGAFHVSPANFWPETLERADFPRSVSILDSTLRKTYFTAGHVTSPQGFVRIAEALVDLGITDTCLNVTWAGDIEPTPQDWTLMTAILDAQLPLRVNVWSDVLLSNGRDPLPIDSRAGFERLVDAGARYIAPGIVPAPDADAAARQADELDAYLQHANAVGITTTITLAQVGLRDFDELVRVSRRAVAGGAARLDLMDSTSSLSPEAMRVFVRRFREAVGGGVPVTMHVHDEFGLATAGALAAVAEGAAPDVSVNGMSYRAGFAALEEVVLALEVLYGVDTGLRLDRLAHVSRVVAEESGIPTPPLKPLTGGYAHLKHMPGDATAAIQAGDAAFPPISHGLVPPVMGASVSWVWGGASSLAQVRALAASVDIILSDAEARRARADLDAAVADVAGYPRWLNPDDAVDVLRRSVASSRAGRDIPSAAGAVRACVPDPALASAILARAGLRAYMALPAPGDRGDHAETPLQSIEAAVEAAVDELSQGRLIDLLSAFNRFGEQGGARPELSANEESAISASLAAERAELVCAAREYEDRFGFRAVVPAEGRAAADVAREIREATANTLAIECVRIRRAVATILSARLTRVAGTATTDGGK